MVRPCPASEFDTICEVINEAAVAYKGVIAPDCWREPYMSREELRREMDEGVRFWGFYDGGHLAAVMGLQQVGGVALIRHAYTRTTQQQQGLGTALLNHLRAETDRPMLVGTWKAATWAIRFYEKRGFRLVPPRQKDRLLHQYWTVPPRQVEESVILADQRWFTANEQSRGGS